MFPRKYKKISKFKRFLLKLLNVYAIDRESLNLVNPNYKNDNGNNFILNDKSILLSNGYLPLDRKISNLDIFFVMLLIISYGTLLNDGKELFQILTRKSLY